MSQAENVSLWKYSNDLRVFMHRSVGSVKDLSFTLATKNHFVSSFLLPCNNPIVGMPGIL